ncbi:MAG: caspase family protein [bacterium]|nr:caspase family protein [bacterium]
MHRQSRTAFFITLLAAAIGLGVYAAEDDKRTAPAAEVRKVSQSAALAHKKAQNRVNQQSYLQARDLLEKALRKNPDSGVFESGVLTEPYYPHYLLGLIQMESEEFEDAIREFELEESQGQIQHDPDLYESLTLRLARAKRTDNQPPVIRSARAEVLETVLEADRETAEVRFHGTVIDPGGVASLTVDGREVNFKPGPNGYDFDQVMTLDPIPEYVTVTVADVAGNDSRSIVDVDLPPLELGDAVKGVHAVIVGVNTYDNATVVGEEARGSASCPSEANTCADPAEFKCYDLLNLRAAAKDAERVYEFMLRRGVPEENLTLLISGDEHADATIERVRQALADLSQQSGDSAMFYFAGHGVNSKRQKNLMLVQDTSLWECGDLPEGAATSIERSSIGVDEVEQALMEADFEQRYIVLDACRTPRLASTRSLGGKEEAGFSSRGMHLVHDHEHPEDDSELTPIVFYATFDKSVSVEWNLKQAGYFTWYLLQGMRRDMSLWELKTFVQESVQTATRTNHGLTQKPHVALPERLENDYALQKKMFILGRGEHDH